MNFPDARLTLIRNDRKTLSIQVKQNEIVVRAPLRMKDKEIHAFIEEKRDWIERHLDSLSRQQKLSEGRRPLTQQEINELKEKAKIIIPQRVEHYAAIIGVDCNRITIRHQRTRWGSCSSKGNLNFNCLLMLFPLEIIDSVVVHELCHRKHMNHSPLFYEEVERAFPDYKRCRKWLRDNGTVYMQN